VISLSQFARTPGEIEQKLAKDRKDRRFAGFVVKLVAN
jgi:hypothetical protein